MKVIQLGKYYPPATGGIETHTQTLCRSLAQRGLDVHVVVVNHCDHNARDVTFQRFARTPAMTDADGSVKISRVGRVANIAKLDLTPGLIRLLKQLRRDPPDIWHLHTPNITMMLAMAWLKPLAPLVITHHSDIVRQRVLRHAVRPLENLIYGRATRVLMDAPNYAEGSTLLRPMLHKVSILPLGIDLAPFQTPNAAAELYAAELQRQHGAPLWLCVGRLIYYKALEVALQALQTIQGKLLIVGGGPMEPTWRQRSIELGVADRVIWLGRTSQNQLVGAYRAATAFWFPSNARAEGFGLVQVEAMAAGCPVINTAIPHSGVSWVSQDNVSGLTVPMNDAPALAVAANRILTEPGLRDRLAEGARRRAAAEFEQTLMAERCHAIYDAVLQ